MSRPFTAATFATTIFVVAFGSFVASSNIKVLSEAALRRSQAGTNHHGEEGNGALSPSVYGAWITHFDAAGVQWLDVLVLLRGQPGWVLQGGGHGGSGGGGGRGSSVSMRVSAGGLTFAIDYVAQPAAVDVNGKHVALDDGNVLLFDRVDTGRQLGAPIRQRLDPHVDGGRLLFAAIAKAPALRDFLRCGAPLPDPQMQRADEMLCARFNLR